MNIEQAKTILQKTLHWENGAFLAHMMGNRVKRRPHNRKTVIEAWAVIEAHALHELMSAKVFPNLSGTTRSVFTT